MGVVVKAEAAAASATATAMATATLMAAMAPPKAVPAVVNAANARQKHAPPKAAVVLPAKAVTVTARVAVAARAAPKHAP